MPDFSSLANANKGWSQTILPPGCWVAIEGLWTETFDDVTNLFRLRRTASANNDDRVVIVAPMEGRSRLANGHSHGHRLVSVEMNYQVSTADLDDVTVTVLRYTPPADNVAAAAGALAGAYDAAHDTAAERGDDTANPENHTLVFTLNTPVHLDADEAIVVLVTVNGDAGAAGVFDFRSLVLHWEQEVD